MLGCEDRSFTATPEGRKRDTIDQRIVELRNVWDKENQEKQVTVKKQKNLKHTTPLP